MTLLQLLAHFATVATALLPAWHWQWNEKQLAERSEESSRWFLFRKTAAVSCARIRRAGALLVQWACAGHHRGHRSALHRLHRARQLRCVPLLPPFLRLVGKRGLCAMGNARDGQHAPVIVYSEYASIMSTPSLTAAPRCRLCISFTGTPTLPVATRGRTTPGLSMP